MHLDCLRIYVQGQVTFINTIDNCQRLIIHQMIEKFEFVGKIGEGSFASVFKVMRKQDGNCYAFKKIKIDKISQRELANSLNEIRILASVQSPYIVNYKEAFYDDSLKSFCLITELAEGDLSGRISSLKKNKQTFPESEIWRMAIQLLFGISSLHSMNIFHRDIKPANILLSKNSSEAKLADMNVSIICKTGLARTQTGTPYYTSPEVWMERPYDGKSDVWSLGCVLYEMAAQSPPFTAKDIASLKRRITENDFQRIPSIYSDELESFIRMCLTKDQWKRPSAKDLLQLSIIKSKMKSFPEERFNQDSFLPLLSHKNTLLETIKVPSRNLSACQFKLPKCNYGEQEKENIRNSLLPQKNNSCVVVGDKKVEEMKLPCVRKAVVSVKKDVKNKLLMENAPSGRQRSEMRREYMRMLRA